jgi:hypothetical protein
MYIVPLLLVLPLWQEYQCRLYKIHSNRIDKKSPITIICFNNDIRFASYAIQKHLEKHLSKAVVIVAHGNYIHGVWFIVPDRGLGENMSVQRAVERVEQFFPETVIICWICNPLSHKVNGALFFKGKVWSVPDEFVPYLMYCAVHKRYELLVHETQKNSGLPGSFEELHSWPRKEKK